MIVQADTNLEASPPGLADPVSPAAIVRTAVVWTTRWIEVLLRRAGLIIWKMLRRSIVDVIGELCRREGFGR